MTASTTENRNRREGTRFSDLVRITEEVLNPRVTCGYSRSSDEERHPPAGMVEPFTQKPEKEMVDISAPIVR